MLEKKIALELVPQFLDMKVNENVKTSIQCLFS